MADWGCGSIFKLNDTTITQLFNIVPPSFDSEDIEITNIDNANGVKTYTKGNTDSGEIQIEGIFDYTLYSTIYDFVTTLTLQSLTIVLPTSPSLTQFQANGYLRTLETDAPIDDKISFSSSFKVSGMPVLSKIASVTESGGGYVSPDTLYPSETLYPSTSLYPTV